MTPLDVDVLFDAKSPSLNSKSSLDSVKPTTNTTASVSSGKILFLELTKLSLPHYAGFQGRVHIWTNSGPALDMFRYSGKNSF